MSWLSGATGISGLPAGDWIVPATPGRLNVPWPRGGLHVPWPCSEGLEIVSPGCTGAPAQRPAAPPA